MAVLSGRGDPQVPQDQEVPASARSPSRGSPTRRPRALVGPSGCGQQSTTLRGCSPGAGAEWTADASSSARHDPGRGATATVTIAMGSLTSPLLPGTLTAFGTQAFALRNAKGRRPKWKQRVTRPPRSSSSGPARSPKPGQMSGGQRAVAMGRCDRAANELPWTSHLQQPRRQAARLGPLPKIARLQRRLRWRRSITHARSGAMTARPSRWRSSRDGQAPQSDTQPSSMTSRSTPSSPSFMSAQPGHPR